VAAYQEIPVAMKASHCLAIAVLLGASCASSQQGEPDATTREESIDASLAVDASPSVDATEPHDATGEAASESGTVLAIACDPMLLAAAAPPLLSQTGCFEPGVPGQPIAAFFPYEVNSPLWSDGAVKSRFLRVPAGQTIQVKDCDQNPVLCLPIDQGGAPEDEGHFDLPVGSMLIKIFRLQDRLIETRFLIRVSDAQWSRYSYAWNEEATEASLLTDAMDRAVGEQVWHYPSQQECIQCHTGAAGRSLGLTTPQLDRVTAEGNQLDRMVALGLLPARPKAIPPYPDPRKPGPVAQRARAYLQANCSFCHRPAGPFSSMDMRFVTDLPDMNICNVPTVRGVVDANVPAIRLVPGDPSTSAVSVRMHNRAGYAMPRLGTNLVDPDGAAVVDQWISELSGCQTSP
jgi:uncharacterized repeat protein (TIGR03806 family)